MTPPDLLLASVVRTTDDAIYPVGLVHARQPGAHLPAHRRALLCGPAQPAARHLLERRRQRRSLRGASLPAEAYVLRGPPLSAAASASRGWTGTNGISRTCAPTGSSRRSSKLPLTGAGDEHPFARGLARAHPDLALLRRRHGRDRTREAGDPRAAAAGAGAPP